MAEAVGVAASISIITVGVIEGIKYAKTCYRATEELEALQEQVEQFANVVREIDNQIAVSLPTVITTALSRAKVLLDDLDQLMQVKLLKSADDSIRTRRRAWAQNKSKINRVKSELNEQRINLIAAISASSLVAVHKSEATLVSVGRDVGFSKEASSRLEAQLSDIQQAVSTT